MGEDEARWTLAELWGEWDDFRNYLVAQGLRAASVETYTSRVKTFLRWLSGDYVPQGPRD